MSELTSGRIVPDGDCLRRIIKHVPERRLEAAKLLWDQGPEIEECIVLIEHVPFYAERAAQRLLCLEPCATHLDCIFEHIGNLDIRIKAGEYILKCDEKCGMTRYAKVAQEVPECKARATEKLLRVGPQNVYDLRVIWRLVTDPEVRQEQWKKYTVVAAEGASASLFEVIQDKALGLYELAWPVFENLAGDRAEFYHGFLAFPHLRVWAWENISRLGLDLQAVAKLIASNELDFPELWRSIADLEQTMRLWILSQLLIDKKLPRSFHLKIREIYFSEKPMPECWLRSVLHLPTCRDEASRMLLAGEFEAAPRAPDKWTRVQ